eukprot:CAMPEP_0182429544 /NCGR_PEP_ID=MMETSP1167-20130531/30444_1 /TAXON_ID=2988 /ORGANISM="Mallomonas Sp, Strain CCMP3275" /LENGTH=187 /DNA_ID=CAMNT_0024613359 /DNA_START=116 /DNA_END=676 /DNA_ORIENTATION=+
MAVLIRSRLLHLYMLTSIVNSLLFSSFRPQPISPAKGLADDILKKASRPQGRQNRVAVEQCIGALSEKAKEFPNRYLKPNVESGAWRTIWTSVSADTLPGRILKSTPSNILGGDSWQVYSKNIDQTENVVFWKNFRLRMIGKARVSKKTAEGYEITINGLEFRWGTKGCPESLGTIGKDASAMGKSW